MYARVFNLVIDGEKHGACKINTDGWEDQSCHGGPSLRDHVAAIICDRHNVEENEISFDLRLRDDTTRIGVRTVTLARSSRRYGGPEEGGWHYDADEAVRVFHVAAHRYDRLMAILKAWCDRRNDTSWRYDETRFVVRTGALQPQRRPHYC